MYLLIALGMLPHTFGACTKINVALLELIAHAEAGLLKHSLQAGNSTNYTITCGDLQKERCANTRVAPRASNHSCLQVLAVTPRDGVFPHTASEATWGVFVTNTTRVA